jgi:hypothetical protein
MLPISSLSDTTIKIEIKNPFLSLELIPLPRVW